MKAKDFEQYAGKQFVLNLCLLAVLVSCVVATIVLLKTAAG